LPSEIATLAGGLLDQQELQVASALAAILSDDESIPDAFVESLVDRILPAYWDIKDDRPPNVDPSPIFRPLYYLHGYSNLADFGKFTREFVEMASAHLEACMHWLTPSPPEEWSGGKEFHGLIGQLRDAGVLSPALASGLESFDRVAIAPSQHTGPGSPDLSQKDAGFSIEDAAVLLMITRKLSMQLFELLNSHGVTIEHRWPPLKPEPLARDPQA